MEKMSHDMRKLIALVAVLAFGGLPATAVAKDAPPQKKPSQLCQEQRQAIGVSDFKALYGTNAGKTNAFGKCVARQLAESAQNTLNAARACREERDTLGEQVFNERYGKNPKKADAFGKCVSVKAQAETAAEQAATINAARACKAERRSLGNAAFKRKYGGKASAFGKCVSRLARA
jgi:hypothetical protein